MLRSQGQGQRSDMDKKMTRSRGATMPLYRGPSSIWFMVQAVYHFITLELFHVFSCNAGLLVCIYGQQGSNLTFCQFLLEKKSMND